MKVKVESPNFDKEWMDIREVLPEISDKAEEQYKATQKRVNFYNAIFSFGMLSSGCLLWLFIISVSEDSIFTNILTILHPAIFWSLTAILVFLFILFIIVRPIPNDYPKRHSKTSYEQEYQNLLQSLEELYKCNDYSNASKQWQKLNFHFFSENPWRAVVSDSFSEKMNGLYYIERLTKVFELVSYEIKDDDCIKIVYATENGDIHTTNAHPCLVKENTKIEQPTLSWVGGLLLTIPFIEK